jgi:integrase
MALYRRGAVWWFTFTFQGERIQRSSKTTNKHAAAEIERNVRIQLAKAEAGIRTFKRVTFDDLMQLCRDDWKANKRRSTLSSESMIKHLSTTFKGKLARFITSADLKAYTRKRLAEGAANGTCNRELALMRRAFNLAMQSDVLDYAPKVAMLKEAPARKGFFDEEKFTKVLERLPAHLRPVATFGYYTGWRKGEITRLRWDQVDLRGHHIRLWAGEAKSEKCRSLPLDGALLSIIQQQRQTVGSPLVFNRSGKAIKDFRETWIRACRKAGCPGMLFHDFRRTAARNLRQAGLSETEAMSITGHATSSVFRRYQITTEHDIREAAASKGVFRPKTDRDATVPAT